MSVSFDSRYLLRRNRARAARIANYVFVIVNK